MSIGLLPDFVYDNQTEEKKQGTLKALGIPWIWAGPLTASALSFMF
jgi:hypothetical protein